jgi:hypothetical protein
MVDFQLLSWECWGEIFGNTFNSFHNTYIRCFHASFPVRETGHNNNLSKLVTKGIRISCNIKRELVILCRHSNDVNLKIYLKQYSKILSKVILAAKKLHYNSIISNSDNKMKSTWKIINGERGKIKRDKSIQCLVFENRQVRSQKEIANIFNKYFLSVTDSIGLNNNKHVSANPTTYLRNKFSRPFMNIKWKYTNTQEMEKIIKSLKTKDSSGYDAITSRIMKSIIPFIIPLLTYICNVILCTGIFPDRLKYAIVKPVFKKCNRYEVSNYRPISLLTSFSKIIEKLIYVRLITRIERNSILADEQFGFRSHSSTEKAAFTLINDIHI